MSNDFLNKSSGKKGIIILKGCIIGIIVTFVFMLLFSALMLYAGIERSFAVPFATVSIAAGTFLAAFYSARKIGEKGYLVGLITGISVFLAVTLVSLIISQGSVTYNTLFHFIIIILSSVTGGIFGINFKKSKKYI
ncbi:MAG: TIGR04086 family membrane protein [Clostridia bacterium]|nr:TIGR04086 family membrane protein [Clostridia bacterium]